MFAIKQDTVELDGSSIDWLKVVANLREQSNFYAKRANEYQLHPQHRQLVEEMRASANTASILASAFTAGLSPKA